MDRCDAQLLGRLRLRPGIGRHAALAADALAERDVGEVAGVVVGPVVIDAAEALDAAAGMHGDERAAVRAAVFERMQITLPVARHDDGHLADEGGEVAVGLGELRFEAEIVPRGAEEDAPLLLAVDVLVLVDPVGDARRAFGGPASLEHRRIIESAL